MGLEGKSFCLKLCVLFFIIFFWVLGAAILGFSLWLRFDFWSNQYIEADADLKTYYIGIYIAVAVGGLIVIFGAVGCFGAVASKLIPLVVFLVFLGVLFMLEVAGVAYCYVKREQFEDSLTRGNFLKQVIVEAYGIDERKTMAIDYMQWRLSCCGGQNYDEYAGATWTQQKRERIGFVPPSCCKDYERYRDSDIKATCPMYQANSQETYSKKNPNLNDGGCGKALLKLLKDNLAVVAGIVIAILVLQIIGIVLVSLLIHCLKKVPAPPPDDVVYEMARTQEKSAYPTRGNTYCNL